MRSKHLRGLIEASIMAALAMILDLLPSLQIGPFISISFAMVPVFIVAFRWGFTYGILSGFLWGLLQVVTGDIYMLHWFQFLVEYFVAFAFVGFAGIFMHVIQKNFKDGKKTKGIIYVVLGILTGSLARYLVHFYAGVVFWGSYAPQGQPAWIYSLVVNGTAWAGNFIFCAIVLVLLIGLSTRLLTANRNV
jgi:thiamine transporter